MQPSSLVFLVIIAIWAAYLLQHWVRRREHLATARSVDRFSEAMHVLERRVPLPLPDLSTPQPRSYAVSPARPSRQEVAVKHAQAPIPNLPSRPDAAVRSTRMFHALARVSSRRLRGMSLLASLSVAAAVSLLAAFSVLSWWNVPVAVAVLVGDVAWLRHVATTERATRRAKGPARETAAGPGRDADRYFAESESHPGPESVVAGRVASDGVVAGRVDAGVTRATAVAEPSELPAGADPASSIDQGDLSGWAPVPVPPPTYTLKARAERPVPAPLPVGVSEAEVDGLLQRRRAAGD